MLVCTFCGYPAKDGRGVKVFHKDGSSSFFCSHKCEVNSKMGRKPSLLKWTAKREKSTKLERKTELPLKQTKAK